MQCYALRRRPVPACRARLTGVSVGPFVEGVELDSPRFGRGLTAEELERALRRYPGEIADRQPRRR
jgi:hypothetical protein